MKNDQVEEDLKAKGKASEGEQGYVGSQDTGDSAIRQMGNGVQQRDGRPENEEN